MNTTNIKVMTPKGTLVYPTLNTPDTKFKPEGEYKAPLRLNAEDSEALIAKHEAATAAYFDQVKAGLTKKLAEATTGADKGKIKKEIEALKVGDKPYKAAFDDEGNETGEFVFNFKTPAQFTRKKDGKVFKIKPDIFDSKGKVIKVPPQVWGGTTGYVAAEMRPYYTAKAGVGVSLRLLAFQIIDLVTQGGDRSASGYGFGATEGGFEASDEVPEETGSEAAETPADGDEDF